LTLPVLFDCLEVLVAAFPIVWKAQVQQVLKALFVTGYGCQNKADRSFRKEQLNIVGSLDGKSLRHLVESICSFYSRIQ